jgi:hypothetical protein
VAPRPLWHHWCIKGAEGSCGRTLLLVACGVVWRVSSADYVRLAAHQGPCDERVPHYHSDASQIDERATTLGYLLSNVTLKWRDSMAPGQLHARSYTPPSLLDIPHIRHASSLSCYPPLAFEMGSPQASSLWKRSLRSFNRGRAGRAWLQTTGPGGARISKRNTQSRESGSLTQPLTHSPLDPTMYALYIQSRIHKSIRVLHILKNGHDQSATAAPRIEI